MILGRSNCDNKDSNRACATTTTHTPVTMQRLCSKLRSLTAFRSPSSSSTFIKPLPPQLPSFHNHLRGHFFHSSPPNPLTKTLNHHHSFISPNFHPLLFNSTSTLQLTTVTTFNHAPSLHISYMQVRHLTLKQRKRKLKSRQPLSPVVSKLKKYKMKSYSSFKGRFRTMNDGQIRRWKEGKRHNAHLKSKIAKRRGRLPALVPAAYAKVMKKLNFCG